MRARRLGLGTAALVTPALLAVGAVVNPAAAASWSWSYSAIVGSERYYLNLNGDPAGLSVQSVNEAKITVSDIKADGYGQRTYWRVGGSGAWKRCVNEGGKGSHKTCQVPGGSSIQYQFCQKDGSVDVACTPVDAFRTAG